MRAATNLASSDELYFSRIDDWGTERAADNVPLVPLDVYVEVAAFDRRVLDEERAVCLPLDETLGIVLRAFDAHLIEQALTLDFYR